MMHRPTGSAAAALLLTAAFFAPAAHAGGVTLELVPSVPMVEPGGSVDVDVVISGLGDLAAPALRTYDLVLAYDPAVFTFTGEAIGPFLGDDMAMVPESVVTVMTGAGDVNVLQVSLFDPPTLIAQQPGTFTLFTASFDATGAGDGAFTLSLNADLGDELADPLTLDEIIDTVVSAGTPLDIPVLGPWGLGLLISLLLGFGLTRLRRARR
ncbi:MAG: IPTL-CTERM sorting domain-containing protein [bacterium]|nr:IPTL-CTERM sorting domain-containing protein [bacterium]